MELLPSTPLKFLQFGGVENGGFWKVTFFNISGITSCHPPPNNPYLGELKTRGLEGYLTPPNSLKSFVLPTKKNPLKKF